ncbi:MAG TPA: hypothetical protein VLI55_06770 [Bryobacteraceae bacterium]|nr:hypothetical protein [Bryobacteraceae bacterium]
MRRWRPLTLAKLNHQSLLQHAFYAAIERPGAEPQLASGPLSHVLHDAVTVLIPFGQRD